MPRARKSAIDWPQLLLAGVASAGAALFYWLVFSAFNSGSIAPHQATMMRLILATATALVSALLTGTLKIDGEHLGWKVHASGALAVWFISYWFVQFPDASRTVIARLDTRNSDRLTTTSTLTVRRPGETEISQSSTTNDIVFPRWPAGLNIVTVVAFDNSLFAFDDAEGSLPRDIEIVNNEFYVPIRSKRRSHPTADEARALACPSDRPHLSDDELANCSLLVRNECGRRVVVWIFDVNALAATDPNVPHHSGVAPMPLKTDFRTDPGPPSEYKRFAEEFAGRSGQYALIADYDHNGTTLRTPLGCIDFHSAQIWQVIAEPSGEPASPVKFRKLAPLE
jgi:hypothetical protein